MSASHPVCVCVCAWSVFLLLSLVLLLLRSMLYSCVVFVWVIVFPSVTHIHEEALCFMLALSCCAVVLLVMRRIYVAGVSWSG